LLPRGFDSLHISNAKFITCITDHMPIYLHLDLPTTPTPTLKSTSQLSPPRTKRLKDKDTKEAFTRALAQKVSHITPTIQKLHVQLRGKKISSQSFAETANSKNHINLAKNCSRNPDTNRPSGLPTHTHNRQLTRTTLPGQPPLF